MSQGRDSQGSCHADHTGQDSVAGAPFNKQETGLPSKMSSQPERPKPVSVPKAGEADVLGGSRAGAGRVHGEPVAGQAEPGPPEQGGGPLSPREAAEEGMAAWP